MVVRRVDREKGTMEKKIARTLLASMVVVPGVLANPLMTNQNSSYAADQVPDQSIYVGQSIQLASYGYGGNNSVESSTNNGLYYDSGAFVIHSTHAGSYTIYIYDNSIEVDVFELIVKNPDFDNNNVLDISDIVKYVNAPPAVNGVTTPISSSQINDLLHSVDTSRQLVNSAPTAITTLALTSYWSNLTSSSSFELSCNSYFTDIDKDNLSYKVQSVTPANGVVARIKHNMLVLEVTTPATATSPTPHSVITVRAYDEHGATADLNFMTNEAPKLLHSVNLEVLKTPTGATPAVTKFDLNGFFSDFEGHAISYSLPTNTVGYNTASINPSNNELSFGFSSPQANENMVIIATDELGMSTEATFAVTFQDLTN